MRNQIIDFFSTTPFRLACTATPAPNDFMELGNHAEFLGIMSYSEMLAMFFVHDGGQTSKWRLKGHAQDIFWHWMGSWAVVLDSPATLGYSPEGYDLPELRVCEIIADGRESTSEALSLTERRKARKDTIHLRCAAAANLVNSSSEQWLVWCDLNAESEELTKLIDGAVEVKGSDKAEHRSSAMMGFSMGLHHCLVTKPCIAGFGMNWQQCHNMIFTGLSDSYEQYYQAVRRCWRFGQTQPVNVYIIISSREGCVKENIERKEHDCAQMHAAMIAQTKEITKKELQSTCRIATPYTSLVDNGNRPPVSRVTLMRDQSNGDTAGDDTGTEIKGTCFTATEEMATDILGRLSGIEYQAYSCSAAGLDPAAELGDAVDFGELQGIIFRIEDDGYGFPNLSCPGERMIDEKYPEDGPITSEMRRELGRARAEITKTASEITLMVQDRTSVISSDLNRLEENTNESLDSVNQSIQELTERVGISVTPDQVEIAIEKKLTQGVDSVTTKTGFTFGDEGLTVNKTGSEMTTQVTEDGMTVSRSGTQVLVANNQGVQATNLNANTFLIIGGKARFEKYGADRIGCFWIGG